MSGEFPMSRKTAVRKMSKYQFIIIIELYFIYGRNDRCLVKNHHCHMWAHLNRGVILYNNKIHTTSDIVLYFTFFF